MRHRVLSLAVATVLAATAGALSAGPAEAAGNTLTVTAIGRNGAQVFAAVTLENVKTMQTVQTNNRKPIALPRGTWTLIVDIETPDTSVYRMSDTLATTRVTVGGATRVTLDARKGKQVVATVDATSGAAGANYGGLETAVACPSNDVGALMGVYNIPGKVYEVPNPGATQIQFSWMRTWAGDMAAGPGEPNSSDFYAVMASTKGMPVTPAATFHKASMAKVGITMRTGETSQPVNSVLASPQTANNCANMLYGYADMLGTGNSGNAYFSPGTWQLNGYNDTGSNAADTNADRTLTLVGGRSYRQGFGQAVWGPAAGLPLVAHRQIQFSPYAMIADTNDGTNGAAGTRDVVTLSRAGHVLKQEILRTGIGTPAFVQSIGSAGWYDLHVTATRLLGAELSNEITLAWHFHASPSASQVAPGYLATLTPWGVNWANAVPAAHTTPVVITLRRTDEPGPGQPEPYPYASETLRSLAAYASHDGGHTWQQVRVVRSGGAWVAEVPEPAKAGAVSLRTVAVDTAGDSSTQTVYNAYLVG